MRQPVRPSCRLLFPIAALLAAIAGLFAAPGEAQAQLDESNPAVFWRLERQRQDARQDARRPRVVIQRPTRMSRGVAPRRGFAREVPADSAAAASAASAAAPASATSETLAAAPGPDAAAATPAGPPFVIAVFGDNVGAMLAHGLAEAYADRNVHVVRRARENSGLVRDDYFDWPKAVQDALASDEKIDLAVMMIGSNDRQPIREDGQTADVLSDRWKDIYRARALAIAEAFKQKGVPLIWVGMTVMKNERLSADLVQFNEIYREAAQKAGMTFVDVWEPFVDERNRFTLSGPDLNGHPTRIRTGDGVHFTRAGARKLAHFIEGDVKRHIDQRATGSAAAGFPALGPLGASLEARPPAGVSGPGGAPIPLPAPEPVAPVPAKPIAGPVLPLTARAVSPGGELATRPGSPGAGESDAPPESRAGRADDFRWPRQ